MCREQDLRDVLRRVLADESGAKGEAQRLLDRMDEDDEAVRRERDPYGNDFGTRW